MQAMSGFALPFRRLGGCVVALVLVISALFASSAGATTVPVTHSDLALGDSLAFGYSQQLYNENEKAGDPATAFEHGYANYYFNGSKAKAAGDQLINDGCPGETTDSMIGNKALGAALDPTEGESPCPYQEAWNAFHKNGLGGPLHHPYVGKSQLEDALGVIGTEAAVGKPVQTVTLNIGANDELHAIAKCEAEAKPSEEAAFIKALEEGKSEKEAHEAAEAAGKAFVKKCVEEHATKLFEHILHNIGSIVFSLRHGSLFGSVDYTGKIVFPGAYDPFGNVFGTGELLTGSNTLASILDFHEKKLLTDEGVEAAEEGHEPFKACFTEVQKTFNPGTAKEPTNLQKWTNMANFTEFEGKKNGPDIHPTPLGYHEIGGVLMLKQCGPVE
ncbi:MAG TPA: hypothetical protein VNZ01_10245 [Solirubrobacteraceae bacterium]|jgi:hypothetical protein|nr:hypothetical protein [Solirubrobacteraceae bacterium]